MQLGTFVRERRSSSFEGLTKRLYITIEGYPLLKKPSLFLDLIFNLIFNLSYSNIVEKRSLLPQLNRSVSCEIKIDLEPNAVIIHTFLMF